MGRGGGPAAGGGRGRVHRDDAAPQWCSLAGSGSRCRGLQPTASGSRPLQRASRTGFWTQAPCFPLQTPCIAINWRRDGVTRDNCPQLLNTLASGEGGLDGGGVGFGARPPPRRSAPGLAQVALGCEGRTWTFCSPMGLQLSRATLQGSTRLHGVPGVSGGSRPPCGGHVGGWLPLS